LSQRPLDVLKAGATGSTADARSEASMQVNKDRILELLREQGDHETAAQADRELPDEVDVERDAGLLEGLGLDPKEVLQKISGEGIPRLS
jgi:hypothetical protein